MNGGKLQDRLYWGLGLCARRLGQSTDAFRPSGPFQPLAAKNRFLRLPTTFTSSYGQYGQTNEFGNALWYGVFDASYTKPGDYLVTAHATYFVVSQAPLLPVLCTKTNRTISIARPNIQANTGSNAYGGYTSGGSTLIMVDWPASILGEGRTSHSTADLPTDQGTSYWNVLIPSHVGVVLSPGDIITDDLGRTAVISATELTDLGWRIIAKMATT
jgi:hypothetical protein